MLLEKSPRNFPAAYSISRVSQVNATNMFPIALIGYIGFRFTLDLFSFFLDDVVRKLLVDYGFGEGIVAARDALAAFIGLP